MISEQSFQEYKIGNKDEKIENDSQLNQSKYSNMMDHSFMKVNNKIDEFKNSIKDKIRIMRNSNLVYSNNSKNHQPSSLRTSESNNNMVSNDAKSLLNSNNPEESENRLNSQSKEEYVIFNNFKKRNEQKGCSSEKLVDFNNNKFHENVNHYFESNKTNNNEIDSTSHRILTNCEKNENLGLYMISPIKFKSNIVDNLEYKLSDDVIPHEKTKTIRNTISNDFISSKDFNEIDQHLNLNKETQKLKSKKLNFQYKSKYRILLDKYRKNRREFKQVKHSYNKIKKINQFLKYKSFFENVKQNSINSNISIPACTNSMKTTKMTTILKEDEEEKKMNKRLLDKLEENIKIFDQLENEITSKDNLIINLKSIIESQKKTIDKLVEHYDLVCKNAQNENSLKEFMMILNHHSPNRNNNNISSNQMNQSLMKKSIPDKEGKIRKLDNTYGLRQNSMNSLSYNLSKSNNKREDPLIEDCSVFITDNEKVSDNLVEIHTHINEEKSLKLADLTSYELLKKNSFLESQNNYKFSVSESLKSPSYNENVFNNH